MEANLLLGHEIDEREYDLAAAIKNIQGYQFPVQYSDMTRTYFRVTGEQLGGELGAARVQLLEKFIRREARVHQKQFPDQIHRHATIDHLMRPSA